MSKNEIRNKIINLRNNLTEEEMKKANNRIKDKVINSDIYKNAKSIFIYVSFGSEVSTTDIINDALQSGKEVYVPKTNKKAKEMEAIRIYNLNNMTVDKWGILEPINVDKDKIGKEFDLIIMPGVAFDRKGNRIGYGGGYYDKYISKYQKKTTLLALAYDIQIVDNIESEEHDIRVDYIISN